MVSSGQTVASMVKKQAAPPIKLEIGSARKTPMVPKPNSFGRRRVKGTTIIALRSREKKMASLDFPRAIKVDCPENCRDIMKNPKK